MKIHQHIYLCVTNPALCKVNHCAAHSGSSRPRAMINHHTSKYRDVLVCMDRSDVTCGSLQVINVVPNTSFCGSLQVINVVPNTSFLYRFGYHQVLCVNLPPSFLYTCILFVPSFVFFYASKMISWSSWGEPERACIADLIFCHGIQTMDNSRICHCCCFMSIW